MRLVSFSVLGAVAADLASPRRSLAPLRPQRSSGGEASARGGCGGGAHGRSAHLVQSCVLLAPTVFSLGEDDDHFRLVSRLRGGSTDPYDDSFYGADGWNGEAYVGSNGEYEYDQHQTRKGPRGGPTESFAAVEKLLPDRKTGMIMVILGAASTMLGISLFFEKNLVRIGNVLLLSGAPIVIGPQRAVRYVLQPTKFRGSLVFTLGFMLVLSGHPLIGIIVEVFGFCNLFGNLFPLLGTMLKRLPLMSQLAGLSKPTSGGGVNFDY